MSLPTWEIVIITVISATILAAAIYVFLRCWKSIISISEDANKRKQSPRTKTWTARAGNTTQEVYGVPYQQQDVTPLQLDPTKLQGIVMEGKSDLHPHYLEKREHMGEPMIGHSNSLVGHKVVWSPDQILIESEFLPPTTSTHAYSITGYLKNGSPKPRKMVHINYDRGDDGAPEIRAVTTDVPVTLETETPTPDSCLSIDEVFEALEKSQSDKPVDTPHVTLEAPPERRVLHFPRGTWVEFDDEARGNLPAVLPLSSDC